MKTKFLELTAALLQLDSIEGSIKDYEEVITKKVEEYNEFFKLNNENVRFKSHDNGVILAPVPFASTGEKIKIALIGLNPKYDSNQAAKEKIKSGDNWDQYSDFYNSSRTFEYVIKEKDSTYYKNKIKLIYGLLTGKSTGIKEIEKEYGKSKYDIFTDLTTNNPLLLTEFIPFHSTNFQPQDLKYYKKAYESLDGFAEYIDGLIKMIEETIEDDGLIIVDGNDPSNFFREFYGAEMVSLYEKYTSTKTSGEKLVFGIYKWRNKNVVLAGYVTCGQGAQLNSVDKVQEMLDEIRKHCNIRLKG